jgi:hypothetical protein
MLVLPLISLMLSLSPSSGPIQTEAFVSAQNFIIPLRRLICISFIMTTQKAIVQEEKREKHSAAR